MQILFTVFAKLLGVLLTYWGVTTLTNGFLAPGGVHAPVFHLASTGIAFAFAYALLVRTQWLSRRLGIGGSTGSDASVLFDGLDQEGVVRTGIILIGLYLFVVRLAIVLNLVYIHLGPARVDGIGSPLVRTLIECVPLLVALVMVFRAERIARFVLSVEGSRSGASRQ